MSEIKLTNEEIEKRIHNAYMDGRADAIEEVMRYTYSMVSIEKFVLQKFLKKLRENDNGN